MRRDDPDIKRAVRRVKRGQNYREAARAEGVSSATLRRECIRLGINPPVWCLRKSEWVGVLQHAKERGVSAATVAEEQQVTRARISQLTHRLGIELADGRKGALRWGR
jgi:hypothetical protein